MLPPDVRNCAAERGRSSTGYRKSRSEDAVSEIPNRLEVWVEDVASTTERLGRHEVGRRKDNPFERPQIGVLTLGGQVRYPIGRDIGRHVVADGVQKPRQGDDDVAARQLVGNGSEHLLLTLSAREIAVADALPRPDVGERRRAVQMVRPGLEVKPRAVRERVVERGIVDRPFDYDIDPTDGVDHLP